MDLRVSAATCMFPGHAVSDKRGYGLSRPCANFFLSRGLWISVSSGQPSTATFAYDVATAVCPQAPVLASSNGDRVSTRRTFSSHRRGSSSSCHWCTAREPDAWLRSRVGLAPEPEFHPPPHFQQREQFAPTMAQRPPQKRCVTLFRYCAVLAVLTPTTSRSQSCSCDCPQRDNLIPRARGPRNPNFG